MLTSKPKLWQDEPAKYNNQKIFGKYQAIANNILKYLSPFPISVNEIKGILRRRDFAHVSPEAIHVRKIIVYLHSVVESNSNVLMNVCACQCLLST